MKASVLRAMLALAAASWAAGGGAVSLAAEPIAAPSRPPAAADTAAPLPPVAEVLARVNGRPQGRSLSQRITVTLASRDGTSRERGMRIFRRDTTDEVQTVLFFTEPASLSGTGLLVRDYAEDGRDDGLWLYLPAMRNVRRISSGGRGEGFFDTDFTYIEIATDTRLRTDLLRFEVSGREDEGGVPCVKLSATPVDAALAREMGYARAEYWVDEAAWIPRRVLLRGSGDAPQKEIRFDDLRMVQGYLTVHRRSAVQLGTGRRTTFTSRDFAYDTDLPASLFTESGLSHGPPR
jgi:outer membrane lipoprotein-sorting protein